MAPVVTEHGHRAAPVECAPLTGVTATPLQSFPTVAVATAPAVGATGQGRRPPEPGIVPWSRISTSLTAGDPARPTREPRPHSAPHRTSHRTQPPPPRARVFRVLRHHRRDPAMTSPPGGLTRRNRLAPDSRPPCAFPCLAGTGVASAGSGPPRHSSRDAVAAATTVPHHRRHSFPRQPPTPLLTGPPPTIVRSMS
jgi:hypothetical protein